MNNEERVKIFEDTLKMSKRFKCESYKFENAVNGNLPHIIWSENTVKSILEQDIKKKVSALNFADGYMQGGLVWRGVLTQEEELCRTSNLYNSLSLVDYPIDGECVVSKNVIFFRDDKYNVLKGRDWRRCNIISCPAVVCAKDMEEVKRRMHMIVDASIGSDILILGKWGCGAFGNDWDVFKKLWEEVLHIKVDLL